MPGKRDIERLHYEARLLHAEVVPVNAWRCRDCDWFCVTQPGKWVQRHESETGHVVRCPPL